jgi:hypothetical protein
VCHISHCQAVLTEHDDVRYGVAEMDVCIRHGLVSLHSCKMSGGGHPVLFHHWHWHRGWAGLVQPFKMQCLGLGLGESAFKGGCVTCECIAKWATTGVALPTKVTATAGDSQATPTLDTTIASSKP